MGLTQQQLADRVGVHVRTIRNSERGIHAPSKVFADNDFNELGAQGGVTEGRETPAMAARA
jgi:transcriptional regulator with XRE-family HTH domain